jgi:hypothetical protein
MSVVSLTAGLARKPDGLDPLSSDIHPMTGSLGRDRRDGRALARPPFFPSGRPRANADDGGAFRARKVDFVVIETHLFRGSLRASC